MPIVVVSPGLREFIVPRGPDPDRVAGDKTWARAALPLFGRRAAAALGAQAGILAVGGLASDPVDVAVLVIASVASALALIPATMTHPLFARDLAPLVGRRDASGIRLLLHRRALRIAPATVLAVAAMLLVPGQVMSIFGQAPEANSAWVLCLLVLSAGITAALGILPVLHIYAGRGRVVTLCLAAELLAQLPVSCSSFRFSARLERPQVSLWGPWSGCYLSSSGFRGCRKAGATTPSECDCG